MPNFDDRRAVPAPCRRPMRCLTLVQTPSIQRGVAYDLPSQERASFAECICIGITQGDNVLGLKDNDEVVLIPAQSNATRWPGWHCINGCIVNLRHDVIVKRIPREPNPNCKCCANSSAFDLDLPYKERCDMAERCVPKSRFTHVYYQQELFSGQTNQQELFSGQTK
jgi:hypothetical protein